MRRLMKLTLSTVALVLGATTSSLAIARSPQESTGRPVPDPAQALRRWQAEHGESWHLATDRETGFANMVFGGKVVSPVLPRTDADWIGVARLFLAESQALHGIQGGDLVAGEGAVRYLPLSLMENGTDKMTVAFRQQLGSIAVVDGTVNVLMDINGSLLSVQTTASPFLEGLSAQPSVSARIANQEAGALFRSEQETVPTSATTPELVVKQGLRNGIRLPFLAWQIDIGWEQQGAQPLGVRYWIDAHGTGLVAQENLVHNFDVGGTIESMATPGTDPDTSGNPEVPIRMPYMRINSSAGVIFSDRQGNWNYPGVSGPLGVTFEFRGMFNQVFNDAGSEYSLVFNAATGGGNAPLMNPSSQALVTAAANAYLHVNTVRDFVRDTNSSDATADFLATSNVNQSSTCNAFFNGSSINFFQAGGGCVNTSYSSVVAHELGHWLNVLYNTGNGPDGMGEGNADIWSMYTFDDPIVGRDFCGTGCNVRTGNNNRQYCGDGNGGCYGGVHADGEVWMGAAWKVRARLNASLGNAAGDLASNALFSGWMNAFDQTQIDSIIEIQWLTLDDNDGNINNGTPNYADIDGGFEQQGFPGFDLPFVVFSNVTELPDTQDENGPYVVDADIVAQFNPPVTNPILRYRVNGTGGYQQVPMSPTGGNGYQATIPGQQAPSEIDYYLSAEDTVGNRKTFPDGSPTGGTILFRVGTITEFLVTDFEPSGDEGWSVGDTGDNASTGVWVRLDPNGTAAQSEDDHTDAPGVKCWFTGQGAVNGGLGDNDVDDGKTTLKSPIFDLVGEDLVRISYWRWYSNNAGSNPNTDPFEVDLSNDGGATWTNVETLVTGPQTNGGWFKHSFDVASVLPTTNNMQLRFVAQDIGGGSIVEAMIDDVKGEILSDGCPTPFAYGKGKLNSQGIVPEIGFTGSPSFASNDFSINVMTLLNNKAAILISGAEQNNQPFFGGRLLVRNGIVREELIFLDNVDGSGSVDIPISSGMVGTDRYYQYWYRDPMAPDGNGVGLSNGLCVNFCD